MKLRYQYRVYPTQNQQTKLAKLFGCCRVVFNDALALTKQSEKFPRNSALQKICITQAKRTEQRSWLKEVSNIPLQQSVADLGVAIKNYFDSRKGKRKGAAMGFPRFKKKDNRQSARFRKGGFSIKNGKVYLAKIGNLKTKWSRPLPSEPSSATIIKDRRHRYFLSFVVEAEVPIPPAPNNLVGVDLGIKTFAVLSTGKKIDSPSYQKLNRKIKRFQRRLSKRAKGSNRRDLARLKVAKLKGKLRDTRKDFLHKLSSRLVIDNQVIALEDLNVKGMVKNRCLSRAISEAGWSEFRDMCEAKSQMYSREVRIISRWEPTSQICSDCGYRWGKLDLFIRKLVCLHCGTQQDRDINAAKNIANVGVGHIHDGKWTGRECKTDVSAVSVELSTQLVDEQLNLFAS